MSTKDKLEIIDIFLDDISIFFEEHKDTEEERAFMIFSSLFKRAVERERTQILIKYFATFVEFLDTYKQEINQDQLSLIPHDTRINYMTKENSLPIGFVLKHANNDTKKIVRGHLLSINAVIMDDQQSRIAIDEYKKEKKVETNATTKLLEDFKKLGEEIVTPELSEILQQKEQVGIGDVFGEILKGDNFTKVIGGVQRILQTNNLQELNFEQLLSGMKNTMKQ